jgi:hypothetical protein
MYDRYRTEQTPGVRFKVAIHKKSVSSWKKSPCEIITLFLLLSSVPDPDPDPSDPDPRIHMFLGLPDPDPLVTVWIRIRILILLSSNSNRKDNRDSYCFVASFGLFIFINDVNVLYLQKAISRKIYLKKIPF